MLYYLKPVRYLAAAFCVAGFGVRDVERAVGELWGLCESRTVYVQSHKCRRLALKRVGSDGFGYDRYQGDTTRRHVNSLKKWLRGLKRFGDSMLNDLGSAIVV